MWKLLPLKEITGNQKSDTDMNKVIGIVRNLLTDECEIRIYI